MISGLCNRKTQHRLGVTPEVSLSVSCTRGTRFGPVAGRQRTSVCSPVRCHRTAGRGVRRVARGDFMFVSFGPAHAGWMVSPAAPGLQAWTARWLNRARENDAIERCGEHRRMRVPPVWPGTQLSWESAAPPSTIASSR